MNFILNLALRKLWREVTSSAQHGIEDGQALRMAPKLLPSLQAALAAFQFPQIGTEEYENILAQLSACAKSPQVLAVCRGHTMPSGASHVHDFCVTVDGISNLLSQKFPMKAFEEIINGLWEMPTTLDYHLCPGDISGDMISVLRMASIRGGEREAGVPVAFQLRRVGREEAGVRPLIS